MKVLISTPWYPEAANHISGIFIKEQTKALSRLVDISVFHLKMEKSTKLVWPKCIMRDELYDGVRVFRAELSVPPVPGLLRWIIFIICNSYCINDIRKVYSFNLIHNYVIAPSGSAAALVSRILRLPLIITVLENDIGEFYKKPAHKYLMAHFALRIADKVITISDDLQNQMRRHGFRGNFKTIRSMGVHERFIPTDKEDSNSFKKALFVGQMDKHDRKGVRFLLQAVKQILGEVRKFKVYLVGDGPPRPEYERLAYELDINHCVEFLGNPNRKDLIDWMQRCDFLVLPSFSEGMPCVVLEALCCGKPVVASRVGGIPEVVRDFCGILVKPGDVDDLAQALLDMIRNCENYNRQFIADYARKNFGLDKVAEEVVSVYKAVLKDHTK